ncbi:MAG: VOC family protein [Nitrososphaeria archaeon]|jgi:2-dehydro-3-deoxyphosphogluconate aldolase/(4S)-4-hydroxy-2-oxoglutarate aldolase
MRHKVVSSILEIGLIPTFYEEDLETAKKIVGACAEGGAKVVEFTNRGALAYQVFSELVRWRDREFPDVVIGAGTIVEPSAASLYINCGANFIVGPVFNLDVAKTCNRYNILCISGCSTPSEISMAEEMGADIIKIFPADVLGPQFIKDLLGPFPWLKLMPSGGVEATKEGISSWIGAGAAAINMGSNLIQKDLVKSGNLEAIKRKVEDCIQWIREVKGTSIFLGVEHIAIYPTETVNATQIADFYTETFGFAKEEGPSSIMLTGTSIGKIEVMKAYEKETRTHIAINVSNFEAAYNYLKEKDIELEQPIIKPDFKVAYLKKTDPAGNKVHLIFRP